ncbi:hypothetical protein [Solicola gregarius]|uniref:ABC transporter substrate-binding protein n=1 Tax=Solicola gregarius TaxID=2908642 RepID=A0AA46TL19_9ACTN|nr:hypothetical protein [Solicola gregarius]UYM07040.1 hypothetical protein L0C25_08175 [Solicola gregarius]
MRRAALAVAATVAVVLAPVAPASAIDDSQGAPGFCPDDNGVTVVVDMGALGGDVIVRCAPGSQQRDGLEALEAAGFEISGTTRFGDGAVCRIEGRPAADEGLAVDGNDGYQEACVDMPPASAYWSYWGADNGGDWSYSQWGLKNRDAVNGGFEGWSFSMNESRSSPSAPRIAPVRPESDDSGADLPDDEPTTDGRDKGNGPGPSHDAGDQGNGGSDEGLPMPKKRDTGPAPTAGSQDGVEWTGGENTADVSAAADESSSGAPWAAAGVIGVLGVLIAATAVRRRTRRNG